MLYEEGITGKWLGMLKEIAPALVRVALVANPASTPYDYYLRSAKTVAPLLGIETVLPTPVVTAADIERSIELTAAVPNTGVIVPPDSSTILHRDLVVALAARHRLPVVYAFRFFVTADKTVDAHFLYSANKLRLAWVCPMSPDDATRCLLSAGTCAAASAFITAAATSFRPV